MSQLDYDQSVSFLFKQLPLFSNVGQKALNPSLDKITLLCNALGNPEKKFKSIHIAGTNGKGSTSHIIAACFQEAGYKTGLYTSPHLVDIRERIRINGALITKEALSTFVNDLMETILAIQPSYFELNVAMAFWYFEQQKVDIAVIETGLGGRWDSTNILLPEIAVITNISLDHTQILGNTIAEIATEKAGIIKNNVPVIIGSSQEETALVFSKFALLNNTTLRYADLMYDAITTQIDPQSQTIKIVDNKDFTIKTITTDLLGSFQLENIKTALATVTTLQEKGWNITFEHFSKAIAHIKSLTGLRGRWDWIQKKPIIIADVGHNPAGIKVITNQLQHPDLQYKTLHIVVGFVADKDVAEALNLLPQNAHYYLTQANVPRALPIKEFSKIADKQNKKYRTFKSVKDALGAAISNALENEIILITGSFFIVGEALSYLDTK